jgi:hypothetical protein
MACHHVRDTRQDDTAGAGSLDPQLVTRPTSGLSERLDGNRRLVLPAQPRSAAHPQSLYSCHFE